MVSSGIRQTLEDRQVFIYLTAVCSGAVLALLWSGASILEAAINSALALMLFVTFLQVPLADLGRAITRFHFLAPLLFVNFVVVPLVVVVLLQFLPDQPLVRLGVLLVLLTPCIDYVVTFSQLGRADARLLLAATPALLIAQMLLLPVYLRLLMGDSAADLVQLEPFVHAFIWLIAVPLTLAGAVQFWSSRSPAGQRTFDTLGLLPVPSTAVVLFVVVAAVTPRIGEAVDATVAVIPVYIAFAIIAPLCGWLVGRAFRLEVPAARAIAFSAATRNSLVVLPLALAVPGAMPILPAIIVAQTLVELASELVYIRVIARFGSTERASA